MNRLLLSPLVLALGLAAGSASAQQYGDDYYGDDYYSDAYRGDDGYGDAYRDGYDDRYGDAYAGGAGYPQEDRYGSVGGAHYDFARVLAVDPIVEAGRQPVSRQECWNEEPRYAGNGYDDRYGDPRRGYAQPRTTGGGALVGAIVGGALGNTVGGGDGRRAATVLGAVIGGAIGADVERGNIRRQDAYYGRDARHEPVVERCRTVTDYRRDERVVGYRVTYDYAGRQYRTVTDYHPGSQLRVRVDVTPET